jgi:hypothetical protein
VTDPAGVGDALSRLEVKLSMVRVRPGLRHVDGKTVPVKGYTYERYGWGSRPSVASGAYKKLKEQGGFSIAENGVQPPGGFMVALPGNEEVFETDKVTLTTFAEYMDRHREALDDPDTFFGSWLDPESGKVYLDVSKNLADLDEAKRLGKEYKQLAIYDLNKGEEVRLAKADAATVVFLPKDDPKAAFEAFKKALAELESDSKD